MNPQLWGWYGGAFIVALAVLVVVHEMGHYLAARACNVKVLRFAFGFGKVIWMRRKGADGTEWAISVFPLGGYVKMLDEREGEVSPTELHRAFNRQTVGRRAVIVAAGPAANFLLAIVLYWALFIHGVTELKPRLALPPAGTPAAAVSISEGSTVRAVNGTPIQTWQDLRWEVMRRALDKEAVTLEVVSLQREMVVVRIASDQFDLEELEKDPLRPLGLVLFRPRLPSVVGSVQPGSVADVAGFRVGDRVVAIDGKPIAEWSELAAIARASPGSRLRFDILRDGAAYGCHGECRSWSRKAARKFGRLGPDGDGGAGRTPRNDHRDQSWSSCRSGPRVDADLGYLGAELAHDGAHADRGAILEKPLRAGHHR
jgi:regulator of sigma E protease